MAYVLLICKDKIENNQYFIREEPDMPETVIDQCGGYDLLESLFGKNNSLTNRSGFQKADINSIQSDLGNEDRSEKGVISFQIMLKQQLNDHRALNIPDLQKSTDTMSIPAVTALFQDDIEKANPVEMNNIHLCDGAHSMGKNPDITHSSKEKSDEFSSLTQGDEKGGEQEFSENQIIDIVQASAILPNACIDYSENVIKVSKQSLPMNNGIDTTNPQFTIDNYLGLDSDKKEIFAISLPEGKINRTDTQQTEKFTYTNNAGLLFGTETNVMDSLTSENQLKRLDVAEEKLLEHPNNLQKMSKSVFSTMQESGLVGLDMDKINASELPAAFKSQSQQIMRENMNTPFVREVHVLTNTEERDKKNELSNISGDVSSKQNIPVVQQTDKEGGLSGNSTQGQSETNYTPVDAQIQELSGSHADTQKTTNGTQLPTINFPQDMEVFSGNSMSQLFSTESRIDNEIRAYHGSSITGTEQVHSSIVEQLIEKISMVKHGDRSELKLDLAPPELGSVKIHFIEENDEIEAKIFVENAEVKAAIENNVHRLKESVATSGFDIQKLEVYIQNDKSYDGKSSENSETKGQQHYQGKSQGGSNEDYYDRENDRSNAMKEEVDGKTTNLIVDYII